MFCKETCRKFIESANIAPGETYDCLKTQTERNTVIIVISGCVKVVEYLFISAERYFFSKVLRVGSRIKDTSEMFK